ncbi:hypothetical protein CVT26_000888 [Gymnopilus dilepis]|uniref:Alpha/beta hydrolase fold-3 domain-containing protein n=1 Tax=Gymnopilus dilepis TaxID=231916 RepID=A0A409WBA4_9AGAR|nr:hypothetical protein CVT26_000888 [Gymnopilus dilepis]
MAAEPVIFAPATFTHTSPATTSTTTTSAASGSGAPQQQPPKSNPAGKKAPKKAWSIFGELYSSGERTWASFSGSTPAVTTSRSDSRYPYKYHQLPSESREALLRMDVETPTSNGNHRDDHDVPDEGDEHDPAAGSTSNLVQRGRNGHGHGHGIVPAQHPPPKGKYADVSFWEKVHVGTIMFRIPFVTFWFTLKSLVLHPKSVKRHTVISMVRWITGTCSFREIQYLTPTSVETYVKWVKSHKADGLEVVLEPLVDDATLMWVGRKRTDRVLLCIPGLLFSRGLCKGDVDARSFLGGAYCFPLSSPSVSFWRYVQQQLDSQNIDTGLAILSYSLIPVAGFPTQLRQAQVAVEHILASGVHPSNLQLVGDSAGGNLILSLLSHIMHPLPSPTFRPFLTSLLQGAPIKGVYLMSPWVCMQSNTASSRANVAYDIIVPSPDGPRSNFVKAYITQEYEIPYIDPLNAPAGSAWFADLDKVVDRLFMSAGGLEVLRDDIISFSQMMGKVKKREFTFVVQDGGVHVDPILEFMGGEGKDKASLTTMIVSWLAAGYRS